MRRDTVYKLNLYINLKFMCEYLLLSTYVIWY